MASMMYAAQIKNRLELRGERCFVLKYREATQMRGVNDSEDKPWAENQFPPQPCPQPLPTLAPPAFLAGVMMMMFTTIGGERTMVCIERTRCDTNEGVISK